MGQPPDLPELDDTDSANKKLNRTVAATVVLLSISMALVNIKDGNIVQNMQAAQATEIDTWNQYQANRLKLKMEEIALEGGGRHAPTAQSQIDKYAKGSTELMQQARAAKEDYIQNNYRDDQFDLSDGLASIALATTAIAALVELWWLLYFGWAAGAVSIFFAVAGFMRLPIHPDSIIGFLT